MFEPKLPFFLLISVDSLQTFPSLLKFVLYFPVWLQCLPLPHFPVHLQSLSPTFRSVHKACVHRQFSNPLPFPHSSNILKIVAPRQDTPTLGYALKSPKEKQTDVGPTSILLWFCSIPKYGNNHNRIAI